MKIQGKLLKLQTNWRVTNEIVLELVKQKNSNEKIEKNENKRTGISSQELVEPGREFIRESDFELTEKNETIEVHCFLFNDLILLAKKARLKKNLVGLNHSPINKVLVKDLTECCKFNVLKQIEKLISLCCDFLKSKHVKNKTSV